MAAAAQRGAAGIRRRKGRHRRSISRCHRSGRTVPIFRRTAADLAIGGGNRPVFWHHAGGGLYSYGAGAQAEYFFSPQWAAHTFVEYERLTGSAAGSPLVVQRGSPNQFTFGLGARYSFTMHPLW